VVVVAGCQVHSSDTDKRNKNKNKKITFLLSLFRYRVWWAAKACLLSSEEQRKELPFGLLPQTQNHASAAREVLDFGEVKLRVYDGYGL
jgi:hypothetical protein